MYCIELQAIWLNFNTDPLELSLFAFYLWVLCLRWIGHFRVPMGLCIKTRLNAQPLIWKWFFILMQIKLIITRKVVHLASFESEGFWISKVAYCFNLRLDSFLMLSRFKLNISAYQVLKNWLLQVCRFLTTFFSIFANFSRLTRRSKDCQLTWRAWYFQFFLVWARSKSRGRGTPGNSWWGCAARFPRSWLYFRPKMSFSTPVFRPDL